MEVIILAGGLGTRLSSHLEDNPKPMVDINGNPFLYYLLEYLYRNNVSRVILSVFYRYEKILEYFGHNYRGMELIYKIDKDKLGTGGALKNALSLANNNQIIVLNGDTFYNVNLKSLLNSHLLEMSKITMAVKPMKNFTRYGNVIFDNNYNVIKFEKNKFHHSGHIDGGIICINKEILNDYEEKIFSLNDYISKTVKNHNIKAFIFDETFIDIGTPKDYEDSLKIFK